jgi:hypothetical protein
MEESQADSNSQCSVLQIRLAEYKAAQQSAQHHDSLLWTVTSIIWAGNLVIMGFIISNIRNACLLLMVIAIYILGIAMICCVYVFVSQFHSLKKLKYKRCKTIEAKIESEFHTDISQHRDVEWSEGSQKALYSILTILFIITWTVVFLTYLECARILPGRFCQ